MLKPRYIRVGEATKIELYVPTITPTRSVNAKA